MKHPAILISIYQLLAGGFGSEAPQKLRLRDQSVWQYRQRTTDHSIGHARA